MQGQDQDLQVQETFGSASALLLLSSHAHIPLLQCHSLPTPLWEPSEGCRSLRRSHWDAEQPHSAPQRDKRPWGALAQAGIDAGRWHRGTVPSAMAAVGASLQQCPGPRAVPASPPARWVSPQPLMNGPGEAVVAAGHG